jgi:AcrR family transcriptional regulator
MRVDAVRNRKKLLEVAERLFTTHGVAVEMDEIAAAADLGVGTIYRHFATKDALVQAIIVGPVEELIEKARSLARAPDPGAAFHEIYGDLVELATTKHRLIAELTRAGHPPSYGSAGDIASRHDRFRAAFTVLLERAQRAGAVRRGVRIAELIAVAHGAFPYLERDGDSHAARKRLLDLVLRALAP